MHALIQELDQHLALIQDRPLTSIFFGGGTPSLFSGKSIEAILSAVAKRIPLTDKTEITLEANPGTIDQQHFHHFRAAGINRISLGIQSLQNDKLKILGRIHDCDNAMRAIECAKEAGFTNFNVDIMYGLPEQTIEDALHDIRTALSFQPSHFSWYQLTIEPNTFFYHQTPSLPHDETIWDMQVAGQALIKESGFHQYEVSAYATSHHECIHNRNYWEFGDYLGIGAGAHSKITNMQTDEVIRFSQVKNPRDYLDAAKRQAFSPNIIAGNDLAFEFMLNALRLTDGVPVTLFSERTGLPLSSILPLLEKAKQRGLLITDESVICPSELGKKFLNDLVGMFL